MGLLLAVEGAISQGLLWGVMTLGVYLTFRILDIADLTVDGSFATGGALSAVLIVNGMDPLFSLLFAFLVGRVTGLATGLMNTKLKIHVLLASILTQIALYSVNIRIMGKANTPLLGVDTVMKILSVFRNDVPVIGDLLPAVAGLLGGASILLEYYIYSTDTEIGISENVQKVFIDSRKGIGYFCFAVALLHFVFPQVLFL